MSLKQDVERIYSENKNYTNPSQAVNQASSLNALSVDLYTDSKRFIYELLQNADDSSLNPEAVKVWIKIFNDYLVVAHSGKPFSSRDVQGICNVNNGTKKNDLTKTGYKGIGFKSVFGQSENVTIFSDREYFRFDSSHQFEWGWKRQDQVTWEKENERKFQFPWQIIPIYTRIDEVTEPIHLFLENVKANVATIIKMKNVEETRNAVQNLSKNLNMFLFLKNISEINFDVVEPVSLKINRSKEGQVTIKNGVSSKSSWLVNTIELTIPNEVKLLLQDEHNIPEKLLNTDSIELTLAAQIGKEGIKRVSENETLLYSYLPTDERKYPFPVLVNTSFLTTANRESLHADSKWNQWLFKTIAIEIFNWISDLVTKEYSFQAYQLIPKEVRYDELGKKFNEGIKEAVSSIPFIITRGRTLAKIEDTIVDFTGLSEKQFIGEDLIKTFIHKKTQSKHSRAKKFIENMPFLSEFKKLGSSSFEWRDLKEFLASDFFVSEHTVDKNIELIKYLKDLCKSNKVKEITHDALIKLPFILDHRNKLNYPRQVCFPTANDQNWNNPNSDLTFLHEGLQVWLSQNLDIRQWLEGMGVQEKTDITYITQSILPNVENYITEENALQTIRDLFILYKKGDLKEDIISKLSKIKLITKKGSLCPAERCYFSDFYKPRLEIEKLLKDDIFLSENYFSDISERDEWKRFFRMLGVQEGIKALPFSNKLAIPTLTSIGFNKDYFETDDKKFTPFHSTFTADNYENLLTMNYIRFTENNFGFAFKFWSDCIENFSSNDIQTPATAYWGYSGRPGQTRGDNVINFVPWFIKNIKCIPTISGECAIAPTVLLNTLDIKDICGKYLSVFNGPELSADWRSFFDFRTSLELQDYLDLLYKISRDVDEKGNIKKGNYNRIQLIYNALLIKCPNWGEDEIAKIENWAASGFLLNTNNKFSQCDTLKYFIDGNEVIFQEQYPFIQLSAENKNNPNIEKFLTHFKVQILRQSEFDLVQTSEETCSALMNKLQAVFPYFKKWIENEDSNKDTQDNLENIESKIRILKMFQAEELKITYDGIQFTKNVNVHFDETNLYVTSPWNSNSVLLKLPDILCKYFHVAGHEKKIDFLLRSSIEEIRKYFIQEEIHVSEEVLEIKFENDVNDLFIDPSIGTEKENKDNKTSAKFYHMSQQDQSKREYIESRIPRAVENIIKYLKKMPEYDCTNVDNTATSIISGITKNGNDITVVARPSDDDKVLIFYESEFDVLEYVDAEFWCEDGINPPRQITIGQLLKLTGINRIPIKSIVVEDNELQALMNEPKSETLDFNAVPYAAHKTARIISSFANTNGGTLIFGLKESSLTSNMIVGLSSDFHVEVIMKKAITMLDPIPVVSYDWMSYGEKLVFIIKVEKSEKSILLEKNKYIRKELNSLLEIQPSKSDLKLNIASYRKTVAIIIAIENYADRKDNQIQKVKYANDDALKFKDALVNSMGVDETDIYMYADSAAYKNNLEYDFVGLFQSLTEEDRLIFYYAGHGFHDGVTNYLSTYDMHPFHVADTAISLRKLLIDPLKRSKCKNALIFIDACAQSFKDENGRRQINNIDEEEISLLINDFPYYATFLSCQTGQSSYSCDTLNNGVWTNHLVKAINGEVPEVLYENKYVTDVLLMEYLSSSVAEYTKKKLGFDQNPRAILDSSHENVIVEVELEKN